MEDHVEKFTQKTQRQGFFCWLTWKSSWEQYVVEKFRQILKNKTEGIVGKLYWKELKVIPSSKIKCVLQIKLNPYFSTSCYNCRDTEKTLKAPKGEKKTNIQEGNSYLTVSQFLTYQKTVVKYYSTKGKKTCQSRILYPANCTQDCGQNRHFSLKDQENILL